MRRQHHSDMPEAALVTGCNFTVSGFSLWDLSRASQVGSDLAEPHSTSSSRRFCRATPAAAAVAAVQISMPSCPCRR